MSRKRTSKSEIFLLEFIFVVLFFAICAAFFVTAFVKSDNLSNQNGLKNKAMIQAQSAIEIIKDSDNGSEGAALEKYMNALMIDSDNPSREAYVVCYDENLAPTSEPEAVHVMYINMEADSNNVLNIEVTVDEDIFRLKAAKYLGVLHKEA